MRPCPYILLTLCVLLHSIAMAQKDGRDVLSLTECNRGYIIEVNAEGYRMDNDGRVATLAVDGMEGLAKRRGQPLLPSACRIIVLPRGSEAHITNITFGEEVRLALPSGVLPKAYSGPMVKNRDAEDIPIDKDSVDNTPDPVHIENLGTMGKWQIFRLTANPTSYDFTSNSFSITTTVRAELEVNAATMPESGLGLPERYMIVSRPEFRENLQPFVVWKRQMGFDVDEIYSPSNRRDTVKALINSLWVDSLEREPAYILIVGDAAQIQAFTGTTRPNGLDLHITDLYYAEHTSDYFPDAIIGRWPVNNNEELSALIEKTISYEQGRTIDTLQTKRLLLVAGEESRSVAPTTTNGQVNYTAREAKTVHPEADTICFRNPASSMQRDSIIASIGRGAAAVNYTAHCTAGGWTSPAVSFGTLDTLPTTQPMLFINNCCESNDFGGTCFGEQLLRKANGGAFGVIGATNETLWEEDYFWAVGAKRPPLLMPTYDSLHQGAADHWIGRNSQPGTQGSLLIAGNMAVTASGSNYDKFYWEIYCLLGDPSLTPYFGSLHSPQASTATATAGDNHLHITATPSCRITALQDSKLLAVAQVPDSGLVWLNTIQSIDTGRIVLTTHGHGFIPRIDTITVGQPARGIGFYNISATDNSLSFDVANNGTEILRMITVQLSQSATDSTYGTLLATLPATIDSLAPMQRRRISLDYTITHLSGHRSWHASLMAGDTSLLGTLPIQYVMQEMYPTITLSITDTAGSIVKNVMRNESYILHAELTGNCDSTVLWHRMLPGDDDVHMEYGTDSEIHVGDSTRWVYIAGTAYNRGWATTSKGYIQTGNPTVGFESDIDCYPWLQSGDNPWTIDSTDFHSGTRSLRSGDIADNQSSTIEIVVHTLHRGEISFYAKASSEEMDDRMVFSVDGQPRSYAWGDMAWSRFRTTIEAGRHRLKWTYTKNQSGSDGADCVWIDDIQLPLTLWDTTYGCSPDNPLHIPYTDAPDIAFYPNPASDCVYIETTGSSQYEVTIWDMMGRRTMTQTTSANHSTIDIRNIPEGIYIIAAYGQTGGTIGKIIIKR